MTECCWCRAAPAAGAGRFCARKCRQSAWRARRRRSTSDANGPGLPAGARFAYLDPPYPGMSGLYRDQPTYGGEVDHASLVARAEAGGFAGWALSTSSKALRDVLPLCPAGARVCAWVKPIGVPAATQGLHSTWEPLIVVRGRACRPGVRDWLAAQPARGGGDLIGRKPLAFCGFLFDSLGMVPGDVLEDWFPGTGVVARAWAEVSSYAAARDASALQGRRQMLLPLALNLEASATPAA